jgi:hypothetical protein
VNLLEYIPLSNSLGIGREEDPGQIGVFSENSGGEKLNRYLDHG